MANWAETFLEEHPEISCMPIEKRHKNSIHFKQPNGEIQSHFTGLDSHYQDTDGIWKPLDTKLARFSNGYWGANGLSPKITDYRLVEAGTHSHLTAWIGVYNPELKTFTEIDTLTSGLVFEDSLISESGIFKGVLTLIENGMKDELVINENPNIGSNLNEWFVVESLIDGVAFEDGSEIGSFENAGYTFPIPKAWDSIGQTLTCKRWATTRNGMQSLYTGVPAAELETAVYPVTIDPDFTSSVNYGYIQGSSTNYTTARTTANNYNIGPLFMQWIFFSTSYYVARSFLRFDTSSIGANIVSSAIVKMGLSQKQAPTDFDVHIVETLWTNPLSINQTDYNACRTAANYTVWKNTANVVTGSMYDSAALRPAWVSTNGYTYFGLRASGDYDAITPTTYNEIRFYPPDDSTPSYRPVLTVTYTAGSNGQFFFYFA